MIVLETQIIRKIGGVGLKITKKALGESNEFDQVSQGLGQVLFQILKRADYKLKKKNYD